MKKMIFHPFVLILFMQIPLQVSAALPDFTKIVDRAKDSVVNISTSKKINGSDIHGSLPDFPEGSPFGELLKKFFDQRGFDLPDRETSSLGSGFIISEDGYILTNHHVVSGADEVIVRMNNRQEYEATLIGSDKNSDVALIKIDADELPTLKLGDSSKTKVGEWVLAIGSPFGFDHTVTAGIVSAKGRSLPNDNYVPFIQTDVAINPGNSGGPLFNLDGEVIGINSQIYSRSGGFMGLSFAIPIEMAVEVADQLKDKGMVSRGWFGVLIQEVTRDLADSFGMSSPHGALIAKVLEDSPAEKAGLRVGDVIVEFNGKTVSRSSSLPPIVGRSPVGENAEVTIIRDKRRKTIKVRVEQLPEDSEVAVAPAAPVPSETTVLGMKLKELDSTSKRKLKISSGVLVESVETDSPASAAGIRKGDVISMFDNHTVDSVNDLTELVDDLPDSRSVAVLIQRSAGPVFLAIQPE